MTTATRFTEDELQDLDNLLIKGAQAGFNYEHNIDRSRFLGNTEAVTNNVWLLTPDHSMYEEGFTSFIVTILPDWHDDEGDITYEIWRDELLTEHIRYELEEHFDLGQETKVEELREGSYWTTFLVQFKKG